MFKFYPASIELATAVLQSCTIKFTAPADFNDPFECAPKFAAVSDAELDLYCSEFMLRQGHVKNATDARISSKALKFNVRLNESRLLENAKEAVRNVGVACFSRNCTSILMWSHYATSHKGFCVEYEDPAPVSEHFGHTQAVRYTSDYPTLPFIDYCKLQDFAHYRLWEEDFERVSQAFSASAFLTKSPEWGYEEEVRCIRPPRRGGAGLATLPAHCIKGVILGAKHTSDLAEHIESLNAACVPHAYMAVAELSESKYEVSLRRTS